MYGVSSDVVNTMTVSSDEAKKIATVPNNLLLFKIPGYVLNRNRSAHDTTVVYNVMDKESFNNLKDRMGVNEFLVENFPGGVVHR